MNDYLWRQIDAKYGILESSVWVFFRQETINANSLFTLTTGDHTNVVGSVTKIPYLVPKNHILVLNQLHSIAAPSVTARRSSVSLIVDKNNGATSVWFSQSGLEHPVAELPVPLIIPSDVYLGIRAGNMDANVWTIHITVAGHLIRIGRRSSKCSPAE